MPRTDEKGTGVWARLPAIDGRLFPLLVLLLLALWGVTYDLTVPFLLGAAYGAGAVHHMLSQRATIAWSQGRAREMEYELANLKVEVVLTQHDGDPLALTPLVARRDALWAGLSEDQRARLREAYPPFSPIPMDVAQSEHCATGSRDAGS